MTQLGAWLLIAHVLGNGLVLSAEITTAQLPRYFNDFAGLVSPGTAEQLNRTLEDFERQTSSQIVVVTYNRLPPNTTVEDFAVRAFQQWGIGQKGKDNGAALLIFQENRQMRIEVGYGLEGALPDAIAKRIIAEEISPRFRQGDFTAGVTAGVTAMLQAVRGEYQGTGRTVAERQDRGGRRIDPVLVLFLLFSFWVLFSGLRRSARGTVYHRRRSHWGGWGWGAGGWGGGWSGGGGGGWSSGGGGGGGFMGGGGRSGGGGASGGW